MSERNIFSVIDFVSGYWQLPLAEESQDLLLFITSNQVVRLNRTAQGAKNSAANLQSKVEPFFGAIKNHLKAWIYDFVLHSDSKEKLLNTLETFLSVCRESNLKVSIAKSHMFSRRVRLCGRIIYQQGVQYDPSSINGIQKMDPPRSAVELCEFLYCLQWMASGISNFTESVSPFKEMLEGAYKLSGARTKKSIQKIDIVHLGWTENHLTLFKEFQGEMRNMIKLARRNKSKELGVYTDASDAYWSGVVTQCATTELDKPAAEQLHWPIAFLGGVFTDSAKWIICLCPRRMCIFTRITIISCLYSIL